MMASSDSADPFGQRAKLLLASGSFAVQEMGYQRPSGRLVPDFLGGELLGRQQRPKRLVVAASLTVPARDIDQVLGATLHHRQINGMHGLLGVLDSRSAIPKSDCGRDPMHADVGWPERGEVVIGVGAQPAGAGVCLVEQCSAGDRVALVRGGHRRL
jgi:hypothetical protein